MMLKLGSCFHTELLTFEAKEIVTGLGKSVKLLVERIWANSAAGTKGENDMASTGECSISKAKAYWSY